MLFSLVLCCCHARAMLHHKWADRNCNVEILSLPASDLAFWSSLAKLSLLKLKIRSTKVAAALALNIFGTVVGSKSGSRIVPWSWLQTLPGNYHSKTGAFDIVSAWPSDISDHEFRKCQKELPSTAIWFAVMPTNKPSASSVTCTPSNGLETPSKLHMLFSVKNDDTAWGMYLGTRMSDTDTVPAAARVNSAPSLLQAIKNDAVPSSFVIWTRQPESDGKKFSVRESESLRWSMYCWDRLWGLLNRSPFWIGPRRRNLRSHGVSSSVEWSLLFAIPTRLEEITSTLLAMGFCNSLWK